MDCVLTRVVYLSGYILSFPETRGWTHTDSSSSSGGIERERKVRCDPALALRDFLGCLYSDSDGCNIDIYFHTPEEDDKQGKRCRFDNNLSCDNFTGDPRCPFIDQLPPP